MGCTGSKKDATTPASTQPPAKSEEVAEKPKEGAAVNAGSANPTVKVEEAEKVTEVDTNVQVGNNVVVPSTGNKGRVLQRTTTDVEIEMADGGEKKWVAIEDIRIEDKIADLQIGASVLVRNEGVQGIVLNRTSTDLQLEMADGARRWVGLEDVDKVADAVVHAGVPVGARVFIRGEDLVGTVQQKNTTDVQVRLLDGSDRWVGIEEIEVVPDASKGDVPTLQDTDNVIDDRLAIRGTDDPQIPQSKWCCAGF